MRHWMQAPCVGQISFTRERVRAHWSALHTADALPCPTDDALLDGWALFHTGLLERAQHTGHALPGVRGAALACRASACHARLVEHSSGERLRLLLRLHMRACTFAAFAPREAGAWFWQGWALTQYVRFGGIAPALSQGFVAPALAALRTALLLDATHPFAHLTLGLLHASLINTLGAIGALMGYGVREGAALLHLRTAVQAAPTCPAVLHEAAQALLLLGEGNLPEAITLIERAAHHSARDASEWLWVELARAQLEL